jgi:TP901 family phage tail tape measure protein
MAMEIFKLMGTVAISKDKALKDIKAVQDQAQKASTAMGKSFTKFSGYVEKHSAQIKKAGKYMTVFGGIATAAFALSVKSAANFETQLANVSTMLDESAMKILPEYRKGLQSLSVDFGESTETLSKGLYDILSASIPPAEALGVLEVSAKAAAAGITDTGVAADAITTILNSYGMSADQAGMVSDKLFAIVKGGKTTFAELAPSIGKVAATASMAGLSFDDLGACIATMTRAGIRTEETMTAINGVLIAFLKPTKEAKEAAKKFGLELNTNTLRTLGLTGVMDKLKDATAEQLAAIFPNIRGLKGMAAALGDAEGYARDYALMLDSAGLTQEAFEKQSATLNFALKQLKSMFEVLKVTIGDALAPVVKDITEKVMEVLKRVKEWTDANKPLFETMVKWAAGISLAMLVLGPLLIMLPGIVTALGFLKVAVIAIGKVGIGPIGLFIIAIAGIVAGLKAWQEQSEKTKEANIRLKASLLTREEIIKIIEPIVKRIAFLKFQIDLFGKSVFLAGDVMKKELKSLEAELKVWKETLGDVTETGIKQVDEFAQSFTDKMLMMETAAKSFVVANINLRTFMEPVRKIIEGITVALTPYEKKVAAVNTKYDEMIEKIQESGAAQKEITAAVEDANIARDEKLRILAEEKKAYDKLVEIQKTAKDIMAGIVDKIFEFIRTPYEVKLRDINREYDGYIEKIRAAELGVEEEKLEIDKANYARELAIQRLNAEVDATKGLTLEMQILTAEYKLSEQTVEDTIKYYQNMLRAAEEIVEVKREERDVLKEGTAEWKEANLAYLEARINAEDLKETINELNQVKNEELAGLELIRAKLDLQSKRYQVVAKDADFYKERLGWLAEEHEELAETIAELEGRGEEWTDELVKIKGELYANEEATEALKEELEEFNTAQSDALTGIELVNAELILLEARYEGVAKDQDYVTKKTSLLNEKYRLLNKALEETEFHSAEWFELTGNIIKVENELGNLEGAIDTNAQRWRDFFTELKDKYSDTIGALQTGISNFVSAFESGLADAIYSLFTMAQTNAEIQQQMAETEQEWADEKERINEEYKQALITKLSEYVDAQELLNMSIAELEALLKQNSLSEYEELSANAQAELDKIDDKYGEVLGDMEEEQVTFGSILKTFWEKLVDSILLELARIAAFYIIKWLFGIFLSEGGGVGYKLGGEVEGYDLGGRIKKMQQAQARMEYFQRGGPKGTDTVPIWATPGEYIISAPMTNFIRRTGAITGELIKSIQSGSRTPAPGFANGGLVGAGMAGPVELNISPGAITIYAQTLDEETISNAGDRLFVEIENQLSMRGLVLKGV